MLLAVRWLAGFITGSLFRCPLDVSVAQFVTDRMVAYLIDYLISCSFALANQVLASPGCRCLFHDAWASEPQ